MSRASWIAASIISSAPIRLRISSSRRSTRATPGRRHARPRPLPAPSSPAIAAPPTARRCSRPPSPSPDVGTLTHHRQCARHHPHRARRAVCDRHGDRRRAAGIGVAVAVPRPHDRTTAAPSGARRASRPARARARGGGAAPALAPRRDRPARPRALRHEPGAAPRGSTPSRPSPPTSAHELKNPLASLRSAVDSIGGRQGSGSRTRDCSTIVRDDVLRLDRLITDIAEVSRLDAELSRRALRTRSISAC